MVERNMFPQFFSKKFASLFMTHSHTKIWIQLFIVSYHLAYNEKNVTTCIAFYFYLLCLIITISHWNFFIPQCISKWLDKVVLCLKHFPHTVHLNFFSVECLFMRSLRPPVGWVAPPAAAVSCLAWLKTGSDPEPYIVSSANFISAPPNLAVVAILVFSVRLN